MKPNYKWNYCKVAGVTRVKISSGEDIAHLGSLDQKMWTALNCPVAGLEIDASTLDYLDTDHDGYIRVPEVVSAAEWLTSVIKDRDSILEGSDSLRLDNINDENEAGTMLRKSAGQILRNLGLEKDSISVADCADEVAIFAKTRFNGDGVITEATAEDENLVAAIRACAETQGTVADRSGVQGVTAGHIEKFYAECADFAAWKDACKPEMMPYGDNTVAAMAACDALKDKIADYFMRCKLIGFDADAADAVDIPVEKLGAIGDRNLANQLEEIASYPLARPTRDAFLPLTGINPAWAVQFAALKSLVFDIDYKDSEFVTEEQWNAVLAKFDAYRAWAGSGKGLSVESLGLDAVKSFLAADGQEEALLQLVREDLALESEAKSICEVDKLLHYFRDFATFLNNYVIFSQFYSLDPDEKAVFEVGELFIDQRCCKLCVRVADMGSHSDMAGLSGIFLLYCKCTMKSTGESMDIVAVMTDGSTKNLRVGTNAIFYDRAGRDWNAVITKIVENPISLRQAFWSPYVKFWNFCTGLINKSAAEKENKMTADLQSVATQTAAAPAEPKKAFDIAKFAGIFAAIGMAVGYIGSFITQLVSGVTHTPIWITLLLVAAIMLCISLPSCFIAWGKLRKRNLGPVLNANGWAINSSVPINIMFGATLTSTAKYPKLALPDPFKKKVPVWKRILGWFVPLFVVAAGVLYFTNSLESIGLSYRKGALKDAAATITETIQTAVEESASDSVSGDAE